MPVDQLWSQRSCGVSRPAQYGLQRRKLARPDVLLNIVVARRVPRD